MMGVLGSDCSRLWIWIGYEKKEYEVDWKQKGGGDVCMRLLFSNSAPASPGE